MNNKVQLIERIWDTHGNNERTSRIEYDERCQLAQRNGKTQIERQIKFGTKAELQDDLFSPVQISISPLRMAAVVERLKAKGRTQSEREGVDYWSAAAKARIGSSEATDGTQRERIRKIVHVIGALEGLAALLPNDPSVRAVIASINSDTACSSTAISHVAALLADALKDGQRRTNDAYLQALANLMNVDTPPWNIATGGAAPKPRVPAPMSGKPTDMTSQHGYSKIERLYEYRLTDKTGLNRINLSIELAGLERQALKNGLLKITSLPDLALTYLGDIHDRIKFVVGDSLNSWRQGKPVDLLNTEPSTASTLFCSDLQPNRVHAQTALSFGTWLLLEGLNPEVVNHARLRQTDGKLRLRGLKNRAGKFVELVPTDEHTRQYVKKVSEIKKRYPVNRAAMPAKRLAHTALLYQSGYGWQQVSSAKLNAFVAKLTERIPGVGRMTASQLRPLCAQVLSLRNGGDIREISHHLSHASISQTVVYEDSLATRCLKDKIARGLLRDIESVCFYQRTTADFVDLGVDPAKYMSRAKALLSQGILSCLPEWPISGTANAPRQIAGRSGANGATPPAPFRETAGLYRLCTFLILHSLRHPQPSANGRITVDCDSGLGPSIRCEWTPDEYYVFVNTAAQIILAMSGLTNEPLDVLLMARPFKVDGNWRLARFDSASRSCQWRLITAGAAKAVTLLRARIRAGNPKPEKLTAKRIIALCAVAGVPTHWDDSIISGSPPLFTPRRLKHALSILGSAVGGDNGQINAALAYVRADHAHRQTERELIATQRSRMADRDLSPARIAVAYTLKDMRELTSSSVQINPASNDNTAIWSGACTEKFSSVAAQLELRASILETGKMLGLSVPQHTSIRCILRLSHEQSNLKPLRSHSYTRSHPVMGEQISRVSRSLDEIKSEYPSCSCSDDFIKKVFDSNKGKTFLTTSQGIPYYFPPSAHLKAPTSSDSRACLFQPIISRPKNASKFSKTSKRSFTIAKSFLSIYAASPSDVNTAGAVSLLQNWHSHMNIRATTFNKYLNHLRDFLLHLSSLPAETNYDDAYRDLKNVVEVIGRDRLNVLKNAIPLAFDRTARSRRRVTPSQLCIYKLVAAAEHSEKPKRDKALLMLAAGAGLRSGELCNVRTTSSRRSSNETFSIEIIQKGGSCRVVAISEDVQQAINDYACSERTQQQAELEQNASALETDALFLSVNGRHLTPRGISSIVARIAIRAGHPGVNVHHVRRFYMNKLDCSLQQNQGTARTYLAELAGHASRSTTQKYYLDSNPHQINHSPQSKLTVEPLMLPAWQQQAA